MEYLNEEDRNTLRRVKRSIMEKVCIHLEHATSVSEDDEEAWNAEKARLNDLTHNEYLNGGSHELIDAINPWDQLIEMCGNMQRSMHWVVKSVDDNPYTRYPVTYDNAVEKAWERDVIKVLQDVDFDQGFARVRNKEIMIKVKVDDDILEGAIERILLRKLKRFTNETLGTPLFRQMVEELKEFNEV